MLAATPVEPALPVNLVEADEGSDLEFGNSPLERQEIVTIQDIREAAARIAPYVKKTPTLVDTFLSNRFGTNVYLKHEELQRTSAFKVRGAFNKILSLTSEELKYGVVAVSAGNHAQAVAYAAKMLGHKAVILMPENTPPNYLIKTRGYGADVRLYPTISEAFIAAEEFQYAGYVYVHPFDDREVIAGQEPSG